MSVVDIRWYVLDDETATSDIPCPPGFRKVTITKIDYRAGSRAERFLAVAPAHLTNDIVRLEYIIQRGVSEADEPKVFV